jgi:hypothetical protein
MSVRMGLVVLLFLYQFKTDLRSSLFPASWDMRPDLLWRFSPECRICGPAITDRDETDASSRCPIMREISDFNETS